MFRKTTPLRLQSHPTECGAVCLGIILEHYKVYLPNAHLRHICSVTRDGATVANIKCAAEAFDFDCTIHKKGINTLAKTTNPLIIHWDMNHFVVFEGIRKDTVTINDPAVGRRQMSIQAFSEHYTGICLNVSPTGETKSRTKRSRLVQFFATLPLDIRKSIGQSLFLFIPALIVFILSFTFAGFQKVYFDYVVDRSIVKWGFVLFVVSFEVVFLIGVLQYLLNDHIERSSLNNVLRVRTKFLSQLLKKPLVFFESHFSGELLNRSNETEGFVRYWGLLLSQIGEQVVVATISCFILFLISPVLAIVMVLPFLSLMVWSYVLRKSLQELSIRHSQESGLFHTLVVQRMEAFVRFYVMGMQKQLFLSCIPRMTRMLASETERERCLIGYTVVSGIVQQVILPLSTFVGGYLIMRGSISYGDFLIASFLGVMLTEKIGNLSDSLLSLHQNLAFTPRAVEVLSDLEPVQGEIEPEILTQKSGAYLVVRNLAFCHGAGENMLFCDVNVEISSGQFVGICGHSGAGKTTLLEALSGQRAIMNGEIWQSGKLVSKSLDCGFVFSDEDFITGELGEFISCGTYYDEVKIMDILNICELDGRLGFFVNGNSDIDMADQAMSQGEIQRLCLARALYRSKECVLFDEAFSHVSANQASRILMNLRKSGTTLVLCTHRTDILAQCDAVYTLASGQLKFSPELALKSDQAEQYALH